MTYSFSFDASSCSGCKACQEACKDKNGLPVGVLWRRVIEVTGGSWLATGPAWENSVFAYSLSLACNHCAYPKCAGVCPTSAYSVRPDGVVLLDTTKCMGCGYCAWACPYGAPQYNAELGVMSKCNFCVDDLDSGLPPSCVAACPLRALDCKTIETWEPAKGIQPLWEIPSNKYPFPLPDDTHTEPHLAIKPHPGMNSLSEKLISNREEIQPRRPGKVFKGRAFDELPLVAFTLLMQMAVGIFICLLTLPRVSPALLLSIGGLWAIGGLVAFLHLGKKRNAWRALAHLKKSWLSRETLMAGLFGAAWMLIATMWWLQKVFLLPWLMAFLGLGLLYSMAQIYRLKAVPAWNSWRTPVSFFMSAVILGTLGVNLALPARQWAILASLVMAVELALTLYNQSFARGGAKTIRMVLLGMGIIGAFFLISFPVANRLALALPVFLVILAGEAIERFEFYAKSLQSGI